MEEKRPIRRYEVNKVKAPRSTSVPKAMQAKYDAVAALTDEICRDHLNEEYHDLARAMTAALCRKRPSPLASGQSCMWACDIVYTLGQLNFLSDRSSQPYMAMADLCAAFGVGQSTAAAKAIRDALFRSLGSFGTSGLSSFTPAPKYVPPSRLC